jgi:hypothetical protein
MPGRNRCQSVVCTGFARAKDVKVRQGREHESVVQGGELNYGRVLKTRKLLKFKKHKKYETPEIEQYWNIIGTYENLFATKH